MEFAQGFDIVATVIIVLLAVRGLWRGFTGEVFAIVGLFGGFVCVWKLAPTIIQYLTSHWPVLDQPVLGVIVVALLFFGSALVAGLLCRAVLVLVNFAHMGFVNRLWGALVGCCYGFLFVLIVYVILEVSGKYGFWDVVSGSIPGVPSNEWVSQSIYMNLASKAWPFIYNALISQDWGRFAN
jgi:membrane protein required for colicin V production